MFLCGMRRTEVKELVRETLFAPDDHFIERDGLRHCALKSYPYNVGEFVQFDDVGNLITRLLRVVKVVFQFNEHWDFLVISAYPTHVSMKFLIAKQNIESYISN